MTPNQKKIQEYIDSHPEAVAEEISSGTGVSIHTVKYNMRWIKSKLKNSFKTVTELVTIPLEVPKERSKSVEEICNLLRENPFLTPKEIQARMGYKNIQNVYNMMSKDPALKIRLKAYQHKFSMLTPKSMKAYEDCLEMRRHPDVKLKAAIRQLEEVGVIGPEKIDLNVGVRNLSEPELRERLKVLQQENIPEPVIVNGELASEPCGSS